MRLAIPGTAVAFAAVSLLSLQLAAPRGAAAACSSIPPAPEVFRGAKGSIDRPFVVPGDVGGKPGEHGGRVTLTLDGCQPPQARFDPSNSVVAFVFTPPSGGPRNALLLAESCTGVDERACAAQLVPKGQAKCAKAVLQVADTQQGVDRQLWFDMPTLAAFPGMLDVAGPAVIVVTPKAALRCDIGGPAVPTCAADPGPHPPLLCVDDFYSDPGCALRVPHAVFGNFTVLPALNDFRKLCTTQGPAPGCTLDTNLPFRFSIDKRGNALLPLSWRGVLRARGQVGAPCNEGEECDTRIVKAETAVDPFPDDPDKDVIILPAGIVKSFDMRGGEFQPPPAITVGLSPDGTQLQLEGQAHKGKSVVRIPSCDERTPCTPNQLFNFTTRLANQVGPVTVNRRGGPGVCDEPGGKRCKHDKDCRSGVACTAFSAQALGITPRPTASPFASPPPPPSPIPSSPLLAPPTPPPATVP